MQILSGIKKLYVSR